MSCDNPLAADQLASLWMHRSMLLWSRVKAALVLQGSVLAGWYYAMTDDLSEFAAPLALLAAAITLVLLGMAASDVAMRGKIAREWPGLDPLLPTWRRGGLALVGALFGLLMTCDLALGWISISYPHSMAAPSMGGSLQDVARYSIGRDCQRADSGAWSHLLRGVA